MRYFILCCVVCLRCSAVLAQDSGEYSIQVASRIANSEKKTMGDWKLYPTRTMETLKGYTPEAPVKLSRYGGRMDKKVQATGFFHAVKISNRWWIVDPEGYLCINIAMNSVSPGGSDRNKAALETKFGNENGWSNATQQLLLDNGFNGLGCWSGYKAFENTNLEKTRPLSYTIIKDFMVAYGKQRGGVYQEAGHMGYPDRTIFVFDPQFEPFCDEYAKQLAVNKNDKNLFGYFSDNEMPFERLSLDRYLEKKDTTDPGCIAAKKWLSDHHLVVPAINDSIRKEFLGVMADRYFSIVSKAIKKYDPNHMYLGSRLHSYEKKAAPVFRAAGKYLDVIAVNYYREWTPLQEDVVNWEAWSGKPFIITEWYTKGEDSKMDNFSGAGWIVKTQNDRGLFYQNFTLALLESKNCVGFHWFKYQDNDPTNKKVDPSNTDANKGIVDNEYDTYQPLLEKMKQLNTNVYQLIDFFDRRK